MKFLSEAHNKHRAVAWKATNGSRQPILRSSCDPPARLSVDLLLSRRLAWENSHKHTSQIGSIHGHRSPRIMRAVSQSLPRRIHRCSHRYRHARLICTPHAFSRPTGRDNRVPTHDDPSSHQGDTYQAAARADVDDTWQEAWDEEENTSIRYGDWESDIYDIPPARMILPACHAATSTCASAGCKESGT